MLRILWHLGFTILVFAAPPSLAAGPSKSGYVTAHDGTSIYYEVHGTGPRFLLVGVNLQPRSTDLQEFIDGLGHDYKLIVAEYPGEPKMYTLTPATVSRDYLEVAKAAGAEEFAFYGYSWGAACGLQLALRSDRVKALVAGGFPMIGGPYSRLLESMRNRVFNKAITSTEKDRWEEARQFLTFFESLQSFDDRSIQDRLKMPRLNFVGTEDRVMFSGDIEVPFYEIFSKNRSEIEAAGWSVLSVQGKDHFTTILPSVSVPLIRKWLKDNWRQ